MKRWWLLIALLLSLGVNIGILATLAVGRRAPAPWQDRPRPAWQPTPDVARLADRLGLEGEDRRHFLETQQRFFESARPARSRLIQARRQLYRELVSPEPEVERVEELLTELAEAELALERALVTATLASRKVLSDEQERRYLRFLASRIRPGPESLSPRGRPPRHRPPGAGDPRRPPGRPPQ